MRTAESHAAARASDEVLDGLLDALDVPAVVVGRDGTLERTNRAWEQLAHDNGLPPAEVGVGRNYLTVCEQAARSGDALASDLERGLRAVLAGEKSDFVLEYSCHAGRERRWYRCRASRLPAGGGALLQHLPITDVKRMESRLLEEQEARRDAADLLNEAVETMSEGFALYDADGVLLHCNSRYLEIYRPIARHIRPGVSFRDVIRLALEAGLFPDARGREAEWTEQTAERLRALNGEVEHRLSENCWIRVRVRSTAQGQRVAILTDISEIKRREAALRSSEARFRDFAAAGAERFWETDAALRVISFEGPQEEEPLPSRDAIVGRTLRELAAANGLTGPRFERHLADLEAHRSYREFRFSVADAGGRRRHLRASGVAAHDDSGRFLGYRGVLGDETEVVEARLRAERAESHLRAAVETAPYGFAIFDARERLLLSNARFRELYRLEEAESRPGVTFESLVRTGLAAGRYPDAVGREEAWLEARLAKFRRPPGPWEQQVGDRWVLVDERDLPDGGKVAIRTDISGVKRDAERATRSERLQSLGTLAGGIAHDFNNLLSAILGYGELALDDLGAGADPREHLVNILSAGHHARDLVKQILRFSRISEEGEPEPCRLGALVEEVVALLRPTVHPDVRIDVRLPREAGAEEATVRAAPGHLSQVVMNLVVNATQAIGQGRGRVELVVDELEVDPLFAERHPPLAAGPCMRLIVRDDGPGIEQTALNRVFEPFFTTKEVGQGTGMGLAVVHGIVSRYAGAVTAYSEFGRGAEFRVYLPCDPSRPAPAAGDAEVESRPAVPRGRALVVDDVDSVRGAVAGLLGRLGYEAVDVANAEAALERLAASPASFSLLVTDQVMPGMSGQDLAEAARRLRPDLPVLLCTGFGHGLDQQRLEALGRCSLVVKPFTLKELGQALDRLDGGDSGGEPVDQGGRGR